MTYHSEEFAERNMLGQYGLAYEAVVAARFIRTQIKLEKTNNKNTQIQSTRVQILEAALELVRREARMYVKSALSAKKDLLEWESSLNDNTDG
jgi:fructose-1-phosphate kinase PfkB-like protein